MQEGFSFEILEIGDESVILRDVTGRRTTVKLNEEIEHWSLMAIIERNNERIAVFESYRDEDGRILYINSKRVIASLSKSLEPTQISEESCYLGRTLKDVLESSEDLLGEEILSKEDDPSYEKIASCLPPMRKLRSSLVGTLLYESTISFVGTRDCLDKPGIMEGIYTSCFHPGGVIPELRRPAGNIFEGPKAREIYAGLVGGWLPVLRYKFENWEQIIFADPEPPTMWIQPVWFRILKMSEGHIQEVHYFDSYLPYPPRSEPSPKQFYMSLLKLYEDWRLVIEPSMEVKVPEERIADFCKHSLMREMITRIGDWPKYGVYDRNYNGPEHDGFQDTFNSSVGVMLEWGLFDVARRYMENYLSKFVRDDGSIEYRGPEIGQYGRNLTMIAQYYNYTKDITMLLKYHRRIKAICDLLLSLKEEAKRLQKEDPAYGMIVGWSEADSCLTPTPNIYNLPYYSNSAEAVRGFHDLGDVWINIGKKLDRGDLIKEGEELEKQSEELKRDLYNSIEKSMLCDLVPPHLPGIAGAKEPYDKVMEKDQWGGAKINGRCYCEMLHSGCLSKDMVETIVRYQAKHGGRLLGIPRLKNIQIAGFLTYGYGYGLLQHDLIKEFLLLYNAHMAHIYTRGTWTATESGYVDRSQSSAPYCSSAQLTIPAFTKWMLVFEDPLLPTVWLARGVPRLWLEDGKTISVKGAPTKWGFLSYKVYSNLKQSKIRVELILPKEGFAASINICLRLPGNQKIQAVNINGKCWTNFVSEKETVMLPAGSKDQISIEVVTTNTAV